MTTAFAIFLVLDSAITCALAVLVWRYRRRQQRFIAALESGVQLVDRTQLNRIEASIDSVRQALFPPADLVGKPGRAPPVDNDHVAPGCELFTDEQVAANQDVIRTSCPASCAAQDVPGLSEHGHYRRVPRRPL